MSYSPEHQSMLLNQIVWKMLQDLGEVPANLHTGKSVTAVEVDIPNVATRFFRTFTSPTTIVDPRNG